MTAPEDPEEEEGGFFRRFSRRKLAAGKSAAEPEPALEPEGEAEPEAPPQVDAAYIDALPPIESIGAGSDIKPFLARGVPADLRNAALRRIWSATPGVRDYLDPAVDYAWDWNAPGGVPGGGGTLSQGRVAQMVKDLIGGPPEPSETPEASAEEGDAAEDADAAASAQTPEATPEPPAPVRRSDAAPAKHEAPAPERSTASLTQARRHGGATPD